ncbi:hypothetical protein [Neisseria sp. S1]|uniref:hypothetical protein n=1 Tax=Neisseria sp. S1 TaxID=3318354 RepID=UPI003A8C7A58
MGLSNKEKIALLELEAQLVRLRIAAEYLKKQKLTREQQRVDAGFNQALGITKTAFGLTKGLPSSRLLWNGLMLPVRWRYRILAGAALVLWQLFRDRVK